MARAEKVKAASDAEEAAKQKAAAEKPPSRFDDPGVQMEVLSADSVAFTLDVLTSEKIAEKRVVDGQDVEVLVDVPHVRPLRIVMPTRFTMSDLRTRRIFDDLEAFQQLVYAEAGRHGITSGAGQMYLEVAFRRGAVREEIRSMLMRMGVVEEDGQQPRAPSLQELVDGLDGAGYATVGLYLMARVSEELDRRKKSLAAARAAAARPAPLTDAPSA